jgi:hypothetical protein
LCSRSGVIHIGIASGWEMVGDWWRWSNKSPIERGRLCPIQRGTLFDPTVPPESRQTNYRCNVGPNSVPRFIGHSFGQNVLKTVKHIRLKVKVE